MSIEGYSDAEIVKAYSLNQPVAYTYVAAITLIAYDSLILFHREVKYIYRGPQTLVKWIYILVKMSGLVIFLLNYFAYVTPPKTPTLCLVRQWVAAFFFEVVDTAVIKTLLVLRLRALYQNNRKVAILLYFLTVLELISAGYAYGMTGAQFQQYLVSPAPIPGCPLGPGKQMRHFGAPTTVWATRMTSNSVEVILLLMALYRTLTEAEKYFDRGWRNIHQLAPVLYVFYRDGTIFYIPICVLSMFGFVATLTSFTVRFTCSNWEGWLGIAYYITGTRLIMNIRATGFKFTTSMMTTQEVSALAFHHDDAQSESEEEPIEIINAGSMEVPKFKGKTAA